MWRIPSNLVIALFLSCAASAIQTKSTIDAVTTTKVGGGVEISVQGENLARPKVSRAFKNRSYILDFAASLKARGSKTQIDANGVDYVHLSWFKPRPPMVRIHIRLQDSAIEPLLEQTSNGWHILIGTTENQGSSDMVAMKAAVEALKTGTEKPSISGEIKPYNPSGITPIKEPAPVDVSPISGIGSEVASVAAFLQPAVEPPHKQPEPQKNPQKRTQGNRDTNTVKAPTGSEPFPEKLPSIQSIPNAQRGGTQAAKYVGLAFDETDVVQVLKALAMQSGANIVTAPGVSGKITVQLEKVTLKEALDLVTALAQLKYAQIGNTFVVTTPEKFAEVMANFHGTGVGVRETVVVPIYSGNGAQVKSVVLRTAPSGEPFEIILPSETTTPIENPNAPNSGQIDRSAGLAQGGQTQPTTPAQNQPGSGQKDANDSYVIIVGARERIEDISRLVRLVDEQICRAIGITIPSSESVVQRTYSVKGGGAAKLLEAIAGQGGRKVGNVEVSATPEESRSQQVITLKGRENDVDAILKTLSHLDSVGGDDLVYFRYDVKFLDPRALREEIVNVVPGLRAWIVSNSVGTPGLYQEGQITKQAGQASGTGAKNDTANQPTSNQAGGKTEVKGNDGIGEGLELPFGDLEKAAMPMKLILRGTKPQIDEAMKYLAVVDIEVPKVALELRVVEMSREDAIKAGIDWNLLTSGTVKFLRLNNSNANAGANTGAVNISGSDVKGTVVAQLDRSLDKNKIISRPNLLAIDGRQSEIFIGDVIRYVESIQSTQNGITVQTNSLRVGVRLAVLPRVGADGNIMMDLRPAVSFLRAFTSVPGGGQLPQTSERQAQQTISIRSGDTIAIGGLIQKQDAKSTAGIPLLMDLPIIGELFKRTNNTTKQTEIIIFLSATLASGDQGVPTPNIKDGGK